MTLTESETLCASAQEFYRDALRTLQTAGVPFMVGGAYAFAQYTGVVRHTKDIDLFLREADLDAARAALESAGYRTELTYPHWLAKAFSGDHFVDLIFNLGNGIGPVDDDWLSHAAAGELWGLPVALVGPEEMVFSKVFTMDRGRYDGADIAHLLRGCGERLDWPRLLARFDQHWRVLLSHLIMFGFIYPDDRHKVPASVLRELIGRLEDESGAPQALRGGAERRCQGTLLSPTQYRIDVERWGYRDVRLPPTGEMTPELIEHWTEGVLAGK